MDRKAWIVVTLCVIGLIANYYWMAKQQQAAMAYAAEQAAVIEAEGGTAPGTPGTPVVPGTPGVPQTAPGLPTTPAPVPAGAEAQVEVVPREGIAFSYSSHGGISEIELLEHFQGGTAPPEGTPADEIAHVTLNSDSAAPIGAIGFGTEVPAPVPHTVTVDGDTVTMTATLAGGLQVVKTFTMREDGEGQGEDRHHVDYSIRLVNGGDAPFDLSDYSMYVGSSVPMVGQSRGDLPPSFVWNDRGDAERKAARWFDGRRILGFETAAPRAAFDLLAPELLWIGVSNKFYTTVFLPEAKAETAGWAQRFETAASRANTDPGRTIEYGVHGGVHFPKISLPPAQEVTLNYDLYLGPKEYRRVKDLDEDLGGVMFYGFFSPISRLLMWIMSGFYGLVGNWGWAIVLMTLLIRICIWPLHSKSTRSMKRMSLLSPKMTEIKEKYADDPQRMNTEMMGLYKKYKVNPVAGCLPIFLQMPIFFGFFQLLRSTAELRGAEWMWVHDLSMADTVAHIAGFPLNPLPILMGVSMFVQMAVAPKSGDKTQQMIFKFMPLVFLVICYSFASALALYWTISNLFSIGQTYLMRFQPDPVLDEPGGPGGSSKGKGGKPKPSSGGEGDGDSPKKSKGGPRTGGGKTKSRGKR